MTRGWYILAAFASVLFFPWPLAACLSVGVSLFEPLIPLAVGLFADVMFYTPHAGLPLFSLSGAFVTIAVLFVRSRLKTSIIGE